MTRETLGWLLPAIFAFMFLVEIIGGKHRWQWNSAKSIGFALIGIASHAVLAAPIVAVVLSFVFDHFFPHSANSLAGTPFWLAFPIVFIGEEFLHYWLHRWSHEWRWFWRLHRTHHSASQLSTLVMYRYNVFWTVLMPQAWIGAIAVHLGLVNAFAAAVMTTFIVNAFTHTAYRWDLALRRLPGMNPVFNVLEKIITLPDTHHAHHGLGKLAHVKGNYAVTIFLFDVLFGTAKFPRARQERFGLPGRFDWREELFWPIVRKGLLPKVPEKPVPQAGS